jgi:hypothetical protein
LITDWGDGGHPQPLTVSWPSLLAGAALSWCGKTFREESLIPVLSRDLFHDPTGRLARAALKLGVAHRKLQFTALNETPLGTVITAPPPEQRELFCRNGQKHFSKIAPKNIAATLAEISRGQALLAGARPATDEGKMLGHELEMAARMAVLSCRYMLWQQARADGKTIAAKKWAALLRPELRKLAREFAAYWPLRNKATPQHCSPFFQWRLDELKAG